RGAEDNCAERQAVRQQRIRLHAHDWRTRLIEGPSWQLSGQVESRVIPFRSIRADKRIRADQLPVEQHSFGEKWPAVADDHRHVSDRVSGPRGPGKAAEGAS